MPKIEQKQVVINEIKEKLGKAKSVVLINSIGLSVEQDTVLRRHLREGGVDYKVYKNTMMNLAVDGTPYEGLKDFFAGPSALVVSYEDATTAARLLSKEIKAAPKLAFKGGVIDGTLYDAAGMVKIADIPPREELLSKLLGSFKSPMSSFARVIQQIAEKGGTVAEATEKSEEPAVEPAAEPVAEAVTE